MWATMTCTLSHIAHHCIVCIHPATKCGSREAFLGDEWLLWLWPQLIFLGTKETWAVELATVPSWLVFWVIAAATVTSIAFLAAVIVLTSAHGRGRGGTRWLEACFTGACIPFLLPGLLPPIPCWMLNALSKLVQQLFWHWMVFLYWMGSETKNDNYAQRDPNISDTPVRRVYGPHT